MENETLVESSFSATINAPIEAVDIPSWCFALRDSTTEIVESISSP